MQNRINFLLLVCLIFSASFIYSQDLTKSAIELSQFDFWVGEWNCEWKDQNGDIQKSSNLIRKILDGKVIEENFNGNPGMNLIGKSHSVFDVSSGKWKQTWVDNSGGYLDFEGGMKKDKMVLSRKAELKGKKFLQRMIWYDIEKNEFNWNWERSDDDGQTWTVQWKIHYKRKM
jgi:hypothetical protein